MWPNYGRSILLFFWGDEFVTGLEAFLQHSSIVTILDSCGGTGFPSINLAQRGWDITYVDGNEIMLAQFLQNKEKQGVEIPSYLANWQTLSAIISKKFDTILCRGNSLIYVDSWDNDQISRDAPKDIEKSLIEFHRLLDDEGFLYVDIINKNEYFQPQYPLIEELGKREINGQEIEITWFVHHDYSKRVRTVRSVMYIDGEEHNYSYYSYLLLHDELIALLQKSGFSHVEEATIAGEKSYTVFIAKK